MSDPAAIKPDAFSDATAVDPTQNVEKICMNCGELYPPHYQSCPQDGQKLVAAYNPDEDENLTGRELNGTYLLGRVIGEGGMARVYEATHNRLGGKKFAIKVIHPEFRRHEEVSKRFRREAEAAASIDSGHVLGVYDVGEMPDGRSFMVTELLRGVELAEHIQSVGAVSVDFAIGICVQLCRGLDAAHRLGIVHRDIKPENIFLVGHLTDPTVKIIDFGISKDGNKPGTQLTRMGTVMGTPSFMAPEQAKGETVTLAADVYAAGGVLYNLLTGRRPYDGDQPIAILTALLSHPPPTPRSINPSIPAEVEAIIHRAMERNPRARYASAIELAQALRGVALMLGLASPLSGGGLSPASGYQPSSMAGGALQGGALQGGALQGGALQGGVAPGPNSVAIASAPSGMPNSITATVSDHKALPTRVPYGALAASFVVTVAFGVLLLLGTASAAYTLATGEALETLGVVIACVFLLAALGLPVGLAARRMVRVVWHDAGLARAWVHMLTSSAGLGATAFATLWLVSRVVAATESRGIGRISGGWELASLSAGLIAGLTTLILIALRKPKSKPLSLEQTGES